MIITKLFKFVGTSKKEQKRESGAIRMKERDVVKPSLVFVQKEENYSLSQKAMHT